MYGDDHHNINDHDDHDYHYPDDDDDGYDDNNDGHDDEDLGLPLVVAECLPQVPQCQLLNLGVQLGGDEDGHITHDDHDDDDHHHDQ